MKSLYPSLGRYFKNLTELAHAGCMSKAIAANIQAKILDQPSVDYKELSQAHEAWKGKFDETYKAKVS